MKNNSKLAEKIVEVVNSTSNDYDAKELIEKELWDHYSGLPNPNWYDEDNWDEDLDATLNDGLDEEEWDEDHTLDEVMSTMVDDIEE